MCLSNFVLDPNTKGIVGYLVCGLIAFHLLISCLLMTITSLIGLKNKI